MVRDFIALAAKAVTESNWDSEEEEVMSGLREPSVRWTARVGCCDGMSDMIDSWEALEDSRNGNMWSRSVNFQQLLVEISTRLIKDNHLVLVAKGEPEKPWVRGLLARGWQRGRVLTAYM